MADEGSDLGRHAGEGQGRLISLNSCIEWNGRLEELQKSSGSTNDVAEMIEARLSYFGRGAILALLIVEDLAKGGAGCSLSGVSPDEIQIRVGYEGPMDGLSETPEMLLELLESLMGMEIISSEQPERAGGEEEETTADTLRRVGQILFPIFSRGRPLPDLAEANGKDVARGGGEKDPCSRAAMRTRQDDSKDEEIPGPEGKGRQKRSLGDGAFKSKRNSNSSMLEESLSGLGLPLSLQLLLGGLLEPTEGAQFRSLTEVCRELHQITDRPEIFLHGRVPGTLDFEGPSIIGRGAEMSRLVEAALRVQHANRDAAHTNTFAGISGEAGSGKSYLVESMQSALVDRGWIYLRCKFDRLMQSQSLATIASCFEPFFEHIAEVASQGADVEFVTGPFRNNLSASGIVVLSDFIPSLRAIFPDIFESIVVDSTEELPQPNNGNSTVFGGSVNVIPDEEDDIVSGTGSRSNRLHYLFRCLIQSISSPESPILLFLDDLQWCDETGLALLGSILMDVDHLAADGRDTQRLCVVGTFRTNTENDCLPAWLEKIQESSTMNVENIAIEKMPLSDANLMISEALGLSERHTLELTKVAYTKTLGNVLCLREFLRNLVDEEILHFSLVDRRWVWDIDEVKFKSVNDDIANLVTKKIIRMPADVQRALTVASCFGARLDQSALRIMVECERFQDIIPRLELASQEGMIGKEGQSFRFSHDMVQQAAYELLGDAELADLHYEIGTHFLQFSSRPTRRPSDGHFDPTLFIAANQIHAADALRASNFDDASSLIKYAQLFLAVGERSVGVADFHSALKYLQCGIGFLPEDKWRTDYSLSLSLYESACLSAFACGHTESMTTFLNEILDNARTLEDKMNGLYVLVQSHAKSGKFKETIEMTFSILEDLGETFPRAPTPAVVRNALLLGKELLSNYSTSDVVNAPSIKDFRKLWAVKFLSYIQTWVFMIHPALMPLTACRIVEIMVNHGVICECALGLSCVSYCQIAFLGDIAEGYRLSKLAVSLLENLPNGERLLPKLKSICFNLVNFWVEPLQATASSLLQCHHDALAVGDLEYACLALQFHCNQIASNGTDLRQVEARFAFALDTLKRLHHMTTLPNLLVQYSKVVLLAGSDVDPFDGLEHVARDEADLLQRAVDRGQKSLAQILLINRLVVAFHTRDHGKAAATYLRLEREMRPTPSFVPPFALQTFFGGLTAFRMARGQARPAGSDVPSGWLKMGDACITTYRAWEAHSPWNWRNKLLLLEAERAYTRGEMETARAKYGESAAAARRHRFVNEEGLAYELAADFHGARDDRAERDRCLDQARDCYQSWGAATLVSLIDESR